MIKLASPDIRQQDLERMLEVLNSGQLVQGANVARFERELAEFSGIEHATVVSSGTAALHSVLSSLGIGPGDHVIVPAFTFPATVNVVEQLGADVLLCDVDPKSYVVTPHALEKVIVAHPDKSVKAIIVVHEFGYPAAIEQIARITGKYRLHLIEDAACALGTIADGQHVGYFSDAACFSFHPRKAITTGEGGAVITQRQELADKIRNFRSHGMQPQVDGVEFVAAGLNYRMTDFQAALAIGQLERFSQEIEKRHVLAEAYIQLLADDERIHLPEIHPGHSWQSFMLVLPAEINRQRIIGQLAESGIEANLGAQAINLLSYIKGKYRTDENTCPVATNLFAQGLVLPLYGKLKREDVKFVARTLKRVL